MEPYKKLLSSRGLRATLQRLHIAKHLRLLEPNYNRHFTAHTLYQELKDNGHSVSQASVYNILHQFVECELLRLLVIQQGNVFFDTNTERHFHLYNEDTKEILDIPKESVRYSLPDLPEGSRVIGVDITLRVGSGAES